MLKSELITNDNFDEALKLQNLIFPRENARINYLDAIRRKTKSKLPEKYQTEYFLVRDEQDKAIGLWGHYLEKSKDELWLGWFGVSPSERKKGYGTRIFKMFEDYAKQNGFETIRLYTDEIDNSIACKFYEKIGMTKEYYENKNDITQCVGKILIYSKPLSNRPLKPWNSKFINYKGQREKQNQ